VIRAVLDTNVLASGFVGFATDRPPGRLLHLWQDQRFELVISADILTELIRTFATPYFRRQLTPDQITTARFLLQEEAVSTLLTVDVVGVATHPEDDRVIAAAISAQVEYLVTGDAKLLRLGSYQGVRILSPRAFLDLLESTGGTES
jgi:putative PIN family toxin of toxin-antitoxin system